MHIISYVSDSAIDRGQIAETIDSIAAQSRARNAALVVSGTLILEGQRFFQILEGEENDVRSVFASIQKDLRHRNVRTIVDHFTPARAFADTPMETFHVHSPELVHLSTMQMLEAILSSDFSMYCIEPSRLVEQARIIVNDLALFRCTTSAAEGHTAEQSLNTIRALAGHKRP